MARKL
jgi:hypothetical protein